MNDWVQLMLQQKKENEEWLKEINRELRYAPRGKLLLSNQNGIPRFYRKDFPEVGNKVYLKEGQETLRDNLAQKRYNLKAKEAIEQEHALMELVLKKAQPSLLEVYESLPKDIQAHVEPHVLPDEEFAKRWLEEMSRNTSGNELRSRIEIIINQIYGKFEIPHVYEPYLYLEGYGNAYPDFAVLNVRTRKMLYHEHLGKMDDEEYRLNNIKKLRCYHKAGFFEGENLIVTMESDGKMIDYDEVEAVILKYCT